MTQKFETKAEWYVYYSENSDQKRWVYIDKDMADALLYSMRTLCPFIELYEDLLKFDGQKREEDIMRAEGILSGLTGNKIPDRWYSVDYNTAFMFIDALIATKRIIRNLSECFTLRNLLVKVEKALGIFDIKWWNKEIKHPEQLPDCMKVVYEPFEKDPCNPKNVKVFLEGQHDDESDWVEIKECILEPGMLVDVSKEIKKHVTSFKKFRFVKKTIDKELERLNYSLIDKEDGFIYKIED